MTDRGLPGRAEAAGPAAPARKGMGPLAMVLAISLALAVGFAVMTLRPQFPVWAQSIGAGLAFIGLLLLWALPGGYIHLGRRSTQREFLDGLTDAIADPLVVIDAKGRAIYANAHYIKLASGAARLTGLDLIYAGFPEFAEPIYTLSQAARDGRAAEREVRIPAGSAAPLALADRPVWLRLLVSPVPGGGTTLWRVQDISADRALQEKAFARLQFIITYLDYAPAGFFSTLPNGRIDYFNATLAGWLGLDVAQSQNGGLSLAEVVGEEGERLMGAATPRPSGVVTERFDLDLRDKAGKAFPVRLIQRADFDAAGKPLPSRSLVIPRDELIERSDSGQRLARFVHTAPLGIAEIGRDGILREANAAFLDLSPGAKRGGSLSSIVAEAERPALERALADAMAGEGTLTVSDVTIAGERPRAVQFTLTRLFVEDDWAIVFALDKTESKALEVQLAQSQKMQAVGQLASGIAHDFNNVLTPIIGFADLLLAKMRPTDPSFADVMSIKQNANRAANLVRQLLAFSRRQTLQPKVHALTEAMSELGNLLGRVLGEKVTLKISHGRDLGLVLVDIHQFEQVIINLAVNARDAMPDGGTLSVRTHNVSVEESRTIAPELMAPAEYVACEVEDTGSGIPPEIRDKIWEPFFSTKEVGKGTGLGLSTVYGIVKQTGGFIFCDSELGRGTTFRIYLPRHYPAPEPAAKAAEKTVAAPARADYTGKGRILLVEDEDAVRAFAIRALSSRGYTVVEADSGERALEIIAADEKGFELILSDVVMPEMDGPTLLRELRKRGIKTKVIFISGYAEDAFEKNLEGQTDFAFLPKPFSLKQLVEKVKVVMEG